MQDPSSSKTPDDVDIESDEARQRRRSFLLSVVQPGLAGLMDGSVSSLAPLFAAAFATENSRTAFLVGLATAVGAGISMAFSEALSDDGKLSGRGSPWLRGTVCGLMTFLGAIGHTLPFLISHFKVATPASAMIFASIIMWVLTTTEKYWQSPWIRRRVAGAHTIFRCQFVIAPCFTRIIVIFFRMS